MTIITRTTEELENIIDHKDGLIDSLLDRIEKLQLGRKIQEDAYQRQIEEFEQITQGLVHDVERESRHREQDNAELRAQIKKLTANEESLLDQLDDQKTLNKTLAQASEQARQEIKELQDKLASDSCARGREREEEGAVR